jgi:hypothetical protein
VDLQNNTVVGELGQAKPIEGIQIALASGPDADEAIANSFIVGMPNQLRYGILDETHWSQAVAGGLAGSTHPGPKTKGFFLRGLPFAARYRI